MRRRIHVGFVGYRSRNYFQLALISYCFRGCPRCLSTPVNSLTVCNASVIGVVYLYLLGSFYLTPSLSHKYRSMCTTCKASRWCPLNGLQTNQNNNFNLIQSILVSQGNVALATATVLSSLWHHCVYNKLIVIVIYISSPLTCGDRVNSVQHNKYHGCWCTGSLRRQNISTHDIDYVEQVRSCLTWGRMSTTFV